MWVGAINFFQTIFIARTEDSKSANYVLELPGRVRGDGGERWGLEWARVFSDGVGNVEVRLNTAIVDVVTVKTTLLTFFLTLSLFPSKLLTAKIRALFQNVRSTKTPQMRSVRHLSVCGKILKLSLSLFPQREHRERQKRYVYREISL